MGATLIEKNLLPKQILFFKSNPQLPGDTVSTVKLKSKTNF